MKDLIDKKNIVTHEIVYDNFKRITGFMEDEITMWTPAGKCAIRVRFVEDDLPCGREVIFTYYTDKYWKLESIRAYFDLI